MARNTLINSTISHRVGIRNISDYSPFGVLLPERTVESAFFRSGYQGSERDDEMKGSGNSYTTLYRQLDPRIGRWLGVDPEVDEIPDESPYNSMSDSPVQFNDPDGDCPWCIVFIAIAILSPSEFSDGPTDQNPSGHYGGGAQGMNTFNNTRDMLLAAVPGPKGSNGVVLSGQKKSIVTSKPTSVKPKNQPTNSGQVKQKAETVQSKTTQNQGKGKGSSNGSKPGVKKVLTNEAAKKVAEDMDWKPVSPGNVPQKIKDQTKNNPVYFSKKTNRYYSPDKAGHRADNAWKSFDSKGGRVTVTTNTNSKTVSIVSN